TLAGKYSFIRDVRGTGLIVGVELEASAAPVVEACRKEGFLIVAAHETVLRFVPPLIIQKDDIDLLVDALDRIFAGMSNKGDEN
ncbi:MAG: aminotransferase class III-fold pyridoxal phosphate-dependent enzyme, partial [Gammaproteobacteria bacterium]